MRIYLILFFILLCYSGKAQTYILEKSHITFFSEAPLENIDATNTQTKSIFQKSSGNIAFQVPIKGFIFKKSLMQQHFNENFMDSDRYPSATFSGKINHNENRNGLQPAEAIGELTIRGITKNVSIKGTMENMDNQIIMKAKFPVRLEDYGIKIPRIVFFNIAEVVDVEVLFIYKERK